MDIPKTFIKKGVILTNTERNWESANEFFRSNLHLYYILIMRLCNAKKLLSTITFLKITV